MSLENSNYFRKLRKNIGKHFDLGELKNITFDLQIDWDDLSGENKGSKIRSLLLDLEKNNRLLEMLDLLREERPKVDWPDPPLLISAFNSAFEISRKLLIWIIIFIGITSACGILSLIIIGVQVERINSNRLIANLTVTAMQTNLSQNPILPTNTPILPTNTSIPPTNTPIPPTNTPIPPTNTPIPSTNTPIPPTNTSIPPTNTSIPPTNTPIPPTNTPIPPTNTSIPPTNTPIPPTPKVPPSLSELNILLQDQFSSNTNNWPIIQNVSSIGNGKYRTTIENEFTVSILTLPENKYSDILLSIDATITSFEGNGGFSLLFRGQDEGDIYYAIITIGGEVIIGYRNDEDAIIQDILRKQIAGLTLKENETYNFVVINQGSSIEVYLDGQILAEVNNNQIVNSGVIALGPFNWDGSHTNVNFDNLIVANFK